MTHDGEGQGRRDQRHRLQARFDPRRGRTGDFRLLWLGSFWSTVGTWMQNASPYRHTHRLAGRTPSGSASWSLHNSVRSCCLAIPAGVSLASRVLARKLLVTMQSAIIARLAGARIAHLVS
jgi:hypothetical protein